MLIRCQIKLTVNKEFNPQTTSWERKKMYESLHNISQVQSKIKYTYFLKWLDSFYLHSIENIFKVNYDPSNAAWHWQNFRVTTLICFPHLHLYKI